MPGYDRLYLVAPLVLGGQGSLGEVKGRQGRSKEIRGESVVQGRSEGIMGGQREVRRD